MATTKELIDQYLAKRNKIIQMDPKAITKRHEGGQLTARERIEYFFDKGIQQSNDKS